MTSWGLAHVLRTLAALCLTYCLAGGCAVQPALGSRNASQAPFGHTFEFKGRMHSPRRALAAYGGLGAVIADPQGDRGGGLRNLNLGAGLRARLLPCVRLEIGGELGFGQPTRVVFSRSAIYLGADASLLLRLLGAHDNLLGAAPLGYALDLVASGSAGNWWRAVGSVDRSQRELGVALGLRVTLFSDLLVAADDSWEGPWDRP